MKIKQSKQAFFSLPYAKARGIPIVELGNPVGDNDDLRSQLGGLSPEEPDEHCYKLKECTHEEFGSQSHLFRGSGDARHLFYTVIDLGKDIAALPHSKRTKFKAHFSLVDIHPAAQARLLVILELSRRSFPPKNKAKTAEEVLKTKATLFYTYVSPVMPGYCYDILTDCAKAVIAKLDCNSDPADSIQSIFPRLHLHIEPASIPPILEVLRYWLVLDKPIEEMASITEHLKHCLEELYPLPLGKNPRKGDAYDDPGLETCLYFAVRVLAPPKGLLHLSPALKTFIEICTAPDYWAPNVAGEKRTELSEPATVEIRETWKVNPTFFDKSIGNRADGTPGSPRVRAEHPMSILLTMHAALTTHRSLPNLQGARCLYTIVSSFFYLFVKRAKAIEAHVRTEIVVDDVTKWVRRIRGPDLNDDESGHHHPERFPTTFARMWLSNIPDYTNGPFGVAVHLLPALQALAP